jgi:PAS domain S-box-containing protein
MAQKHELGRDKNKSLAAKKSTVSSKKQSFPSTVKTKNEDFVATVGIEAFNLLFEEIDSPILIIQDGKIVFINKKGWEKFGYTNDDTIGKRVEHLVAKRVEKSSQELIINAYPKVLSGRSMSHLTIPVIAESGELIPVEPKTAIIEYNYKPALLVVARDLRQEALQHEKSSEELATTTMLVHAVAENLKNPMQSVKNATYYFSQQLRGTQQYHYGANQEYYRHYDTATKILEIVDNAINRADKAVKTLLEYTDNKPVKLQPLDIKALLEDAVSAVGTTKNVKIDMREGELPLIKADRQDVVCAFSKLIEFCAQFNREGGILTVSAVERDEFVEVFFDCSGMFISHERFDSVFKPFYMFNDIFLGMALPICKRFVERNGGTVKLGNIQEKETVFIVRLPCIC